MLDNNNTLAINIPAMKEINHQQVVPKDKYLMRPQQNYQHYIQPSWMEDHHLHL